MTLRAVLFAGVTLVVAGAAATAMAYAPDRSLRPEPRPGSGVVAPKVAVRFDAKIRPKPRPPTQTTTQTTAPMVSLSNTTTAAVFGDRALTRSLRPLPRPKQRVMQATAPLVTALPTPKPAGRKGSICGVKAIKGQALSSIPGKLSGCGLSKPMRVTEVSGVRLSQGAIMDCTTAKALNSWVRNGVFPAVGRLGGGPAELKVIAHYSCRTRNNKPGAKISEHGRGRAVDIAGVTLKNGAFLSVLKGWRDPVQGKALKAMHASACGPFGTVLGPNSDKYHKDHFHLDTAKYRSGSYCR